MGVAAVIDGQQHQGYGQPAYRNDQFADADGNEITRVPPAR